MQTSGGAVTGHSGDDDDISEFSDDFNFLGIEGFESVIAALHPNVWLNGCEEFIGTEIVKYDHLVNHFERGQDSGSILLGIDRTIFALEFSHRSVTVYADHQDVTKLAGLLQVSHVTSVKDVEASVRNDDALADQSLVIAPEWQRVESYDLCIHTLIVYEELRSSTELF